MLQVRTGSQPVEVVSAPCSPLLLQLRLQVGQPVHMVVPLAQIDGRVQRLGVRLLCELQAQALNVREGQPQQSRVDGQLVGCRHVGGRDDAQLDAGIDEGEQLLGCRQAVDGGRRQVLVEPAHDDAEVVHDAAGVRAGNVDALHRGGLDDASQIACSDAHALIQACSCTRQLNLAVSCECRHHQRNHCWLLGNAAERAVHLCLLQLLSGLRWHRVYQQVLSYLPAHMLDKQAGRAARRPGLLGLSIACRICAS